MDQAGHGDGALCDRLLLLKGCERSAFHAALQQDEVALSLVDRGQGQEPPSVLRNDKLSVPHAGGEGRSGREERAASLSRGVAILGSEEFEGELDEGGDGEDDLAEWLFGGREQVEEDAFGDVEEGHVQGDGEGSEGGFRSLQAA